MIDSNRAAALQGFDDLTGTQEDAIDAFKAMTQVRERRLCFGDGPPDKLSNHFSAKNDMETILTSQKFDYICDWNQLSPAGIL